MLAQLHAAPLKAADAVKAGLITAAQFRLDAVHFVRQGMPDTPYTPHPPPETMDVKEFWNPYRCYLQCDESKITWQLTLEPIRDYVKQAPQPVESEGLQKPDIYIIRACGKALLAVDLQSNTFICIH